MSQVMESKARPVLHKLSSCHQQDIGEEAAREEEGVKLPRSTRPMIPSRGACAFRDKRVILIILNNFVP